MPEVVGYQKRRAPTRKLLIYDASTRVLVRPIGLDMVEVGGSNPPGPTKIKNPPLGGFFGFSGLGLDESRCSTTATKEAFSPL